MKTILTIAVILFTIHCSLFTAKAQSWQELMDSTNTYMEKQDYQTALQWAEKAEIKAKEEFGEIDTNYATSLSKIAVLFYYLGNLDRAVAYQEKNLKLCRELYKGDNPILEISISNMATFYAGSGRYKEAESLYEEDIEICRRLFKGNQTNLATSINNLAIFYKTIGNYEKAELLYKEAIEIVKSLFKGDHPDLAMSINNLAIFFTSKGRYTEAEPLYKEALEMYRRLFKVDHQDLAWTINNIAVFHKSRGRFAEAEPLYKEALEMRRRLYKGDHPDLAKSINSVATFYGDIGRYSDAALLFKEALEMRRRLYKGDHPDLAGSIHNMASFKSKMGFIVEAESLFKEALEMRRRLFKGDNPGLAWTINNIAMFYKARGRYAEAEPLFKEALEMRRRLYKGDHPDLAGSIHNMALFYSVIGRNSEAEPLFKEALEMSRRMFKEGDLPDAAVSTHNMAFFYEDMRRYAEAELLYTEAQQIYFKAIANYFPSLSEKEKKQFWNTMSGRFEKFNTFVVKRMNDNPKILGNMYDNQLITKSLLFNSASNIKERIMNSGDSALIDMFRRWTETKEFLVNLYKMTNDQLKKNNFNIDSIENVANDFEKEISFKSEPLAKSYEKKKVTWRSIQTLLKPDEAAVEIVRFRYFTKNRWTDTIYYAFLIITDKTTEHPELVLLENGKELDSAFYDQYRTMIKRELTDNLPFERYWSKLYEKINVFKKIYLSPDGIYNKINPGTFLLPNGKYLMEEQDIQIVNSTKDILLDYFRSKQETNIYNSAVLVGNPEFGLTKEQVKEKEEKYLSKSEDNYAEALPETIRSLNLVSLPGTEQEVKNIENFLKSKKWDVNTYIRDNAIKATIKKVNSPRVLHLATHGFFIQDVKPDTKEFMGFETEKIVDNPLLRSGIMLAGAASFMNDTMELSEEDNGILTSYEAMNLNLDHTELVVLSACESGLGVVQNGEGVFGLRRAFQQAGAKTVMMSLWTVNDETTQELMSNFYKNWISGMTKREAFVKAQKELKELHPEPFYWGAFVMVGE